MGKVTFKLIAALKVMDALTKQQITDARIVSSRGFRRLNKDNGIIVLVDDNPAQSKEEKVIYVDSPNYQHVILKLSDDETGKLRKVWLVPGPRKGLPEFASVISGTTEPLAVVSCEFRNNESGLRITEPVKDREICLATFGCPEPEGSEYIISDGKESYRIFITDKTETCDGYVRYNFASEFPLPEMDKMSTRLYPVVTVQAREDGSYYLPVLQCFDSEGGQATLVFSKDDKKIEREILIKPRTRLTEDCLKL